MAHRFRQQWTWVVIACLASVTACSSGSAGDPSASAADPTASNQLNETASPSGADVPQGLGALRPTDVVAYQTEDAAGVPRVVIATANGDKEHQLAPGLPGDVQHPDFSRDGRLVAFDQRNGESATDRVFIAKADGSRPRMLVACKGPWCLQRWQPAFSPSGHEVALATTDTDTEGVWRYGIAIANVRTGEVRQVETNKVGQDQYPRWSPDGSRLVFWREVESADGSLATAIFVVNRDGTDLRRLTPWAVDAGNPDWAPNRDLIVFTMYSKIDEYGPHPAQLFTMRPDGSEQTPLTDEASLTGQQTHPRWTPDGKAIVYSHVAFDSIEPRHLWVINADGSNDVPIFDSRDIYVHPIVAPRT